MYRCITRYVYTHLFLGCSLLLLLLDDHVTVAVAIPLHHTHVEMRGLHKDTQKRLTLQAKKSDFQRRIF